MSAIQYPYIPEGRTILYLPSGDERMRFCRQMAKDWSRDRRMPNCSAIFRPGGRLLGHATNGSEYHDTHGCVRRELGLHNVRYEMCEGCHPKNHSEPKAIADALANGVSPKQLRGAELVLWGHWWCCQPCWEAMDAAGIGQVYLLERSEVLFNGEHPESVVGRQFTYDQP